MAEKVPAWFKRMSKSEQKKYLKEHPRSKLNLVLRGAHKLYNTRAGKEAINVGIGLTTQSLGLTVLDAGLRGDSLPNLKEPEVKFKPPRRQKVDVSPMKVTAPPRRQKRTQSERIADSKRRAAR